MMKCHTIMNPSYHFGKEFHFSNLLAALPEFSVFCKKKLQQNLGQVSCSIR